MTFTATYLAETQAILEQLDVHAVEAIAHELAAVRERGGRLFVLGVGGGAGHASHAVCDLRKLAGIEAYAPSDNISEMTARTNDEGWPSVFAGWLKVSRLRADDLVLVFSVGGGDKERNISPNLVEALELARSVGTKVVGVVGRDGGFTAKIGAAVLVIPTINAAHVTPHTEGFQALIWHLLVTHPVLKREQTKWESVR